jgi:hypothetical protein
MDTSPDPSFCLNDSGWPEPSNIAIDNLWEDSAGHSNPVEDLSSDGGQAGIEQVDDAEIAIAKVQRVLEICGDDMTVSDLTYDASTNGLLTEDGMSASDMGQMLEQKGIGTHEVHGGGAEGCLGELRKGHIVILEGDPGEMWPQEWSGVDDLNQHPADQPVVITGPNFSNPDQPMMTMIPPGDATGTSVDVPLDQTFVDQLESVDKYVATDEAPQASDAGEQPDDSGWVSAIKGLWSSTGEAIEAVGLTSTGAVVGTLIGGPVGGVVGGAAGYALAEAHDMGGTPELALEYADRI